RGARATGEGRGRRARARGGGERRNGWRAGYRGAYRPAGGRRGPDQNEDGSPSTLRKCRRLNLWIPPRRIPAPAPASRPRSDTALAYYVVYANSLITTRRFWARPALVLFGAIGFSSP